MPRDPESSARGSLLWAFAFFLAFQLGLAIALVDYLPALNDPNYGYRIERLRRHFTPGPASPAPTRIVALGSSRTLFGVDAGALGTDLTQQTGHPVAVFNFGVNGAGPITELLYLRKMLREGIVPELILVEVLPPFLAGQLTPPAEARWFLSGTRLSSCDRAMLAGYQFRASALREASWQSWALPWYTHRQALLTRLGPSWLPYALRLTGPQATDAAGWVANRLDMPVCRPVPEADHYAACFENFRLEGPPSEALRELLATCRRARVRVVLIEMPETSRFRARYSRAMRKAIARLMHGLDVPWIDARRWVRDDGFFDADHLHPGGAAILRRKLSQALRNSGTIQQRPISDESTARR